MALTPLLTEHLEHLAANLRRLRRERELSQRQIARVLHVTQGYISLLEHGLRPTRLDHVEALAKVLVVEPGALLAPPPSPVEVRGAKKSRR